MQTLRPQFRHNAWSNQRVCALIANLDPTMLDADAPGAFSSLAGTVKHYVGVEEVYLTLIGGRGLEAFASQEAYFNQDLAWFIARSAELGDGYLTLLSHADETLLDRPLTIPWINTPLTVRDGLIQVLSHSGQHRAQILSILGAAGHTVPDLDYVLMLMENAS